MEDEFYCDLLRDYDGKLLEIQLDGDNNDKGSPRLVAACSAIDISLAKREMPHESPKQPSALGFGSEEDEDEWLRFVLSNFDLDAILSELNSFESHENGEFDQAASILDVSLVDIDYDGEEGEEENATSQDNMAPPQEFGEVLLSPIPAPALRPTSWSTGAASVRYHQLERLPVESPTVTLLLPVNFSVECQHPQCAQTAVIMNMCYEHADLLFEEQEPPTKTQKKRRRAVFSTGTKKKKKANTKAKTKTAATTATKKARKPRAAKSVKKALQKQEHELEGSKAPKEEIADTPFKPQLPRTRRNRRISYGDAA